MTPQKFSYSVAKFRIHFLIGYKFIDVLPWFKNKILKSYFFVRNTSDDPKIPYILRLPFRIVMRTGRITKRTIKRVVRGDRHHVVM